MEIAVHIRTTHESKREHTSTTKTTRGFADEPGASPDVPLQLPGSSLQFLVAFLKLTRTNGDLTKTHESRKRNEDYTHKTIAPYFSQRVGWTQRGRNDRENKPS